MPKKFTFWRNAVISETYQFEAESEEEAREMLMNSSAEPIHTEFIDWYSDDFELEGVEELDPLYVMVRDHKCATS